MECPDRETLARLLDGEGIDADEEVRSHVEACPLCREKMDKERALGAAIGSFFDRSEKRMLRETFPCPAPEEIALYVEGGIAPYRRLQLLRHFCACRACARAVIDASDAAGREAGSLSEDLLREARMVYLAGGNEPPAKKNRSRGE